MILRPMLIESGDNMKYYGYIYKGCAHEDQIGTKDISYDDPYSALAEANQKWDQEWIPTFEEYPARFLVVHGIDGENTTMAFFQFSDFHACQAFIDRGEKIRWSPKDEQVWQGNISLM